MLDRCVDEFGQLSECHDFVKFGGDFAAGHTEDGAGKEGVFAAGELWMEASADFEERADASVNVGPALRRPSDPRQNFQEGCLTRSVAADQAQYLSFAHF